MKIGKFYKKLGKIEKNCTKTLYRAMVFCFF